MNIYSYYFIIFLMEGLIFWQYCSSCFYSRHPKWLEGIVLLLLYGILFLIAPVHLLWLNTPAFLLINFCFLYFFYQTKWYTAIFYAFISTILMGVGELIVIGLGLCLIPDFYETQSSFKNTVIQGILSKIVYFCFMQILICFSKKRRQSIHIYDKSFLLFTAAEMVSLSVLVSLIIICQNLPLDHYVSWIVTGSAVFLMIFSLLIGEIYRYYQRKNMEFIEMQITCQREQNTLHYYQMLHQQNENQRLMIHDIKKHLQSIAILNAQGNTQKIDEYLKQLNSSPALQPSKHICSNELLNAILCRYDTQSQMQNIIFHMDIRDNAVSFLSENDLTSLFCNLLDNAFEAAAQAKFSLVELSVSSQGNTAFSLITIINSCQKDPFIHGKKGCILPKRMLLFTVWAQKSYNRLLKNIMAKLKTILRMKPALFIP